MKLFAFLLHTCRRRVAFSVATALAGGACNAALIAVINMTVNRSRFSLSTLAGCFLALTVAKVLTNYISQVFLVRYAQEAASDLRRDLVRKILQVPLRQLEELGIPSILVALTDDVTNVTQALLAFPIVTVNVAMLLGGAVYLGLLSWQILLGTMILIVFGGVSYRLLMRSALRCLSEAREEEDKLYRHFRALTEGIKELKLHRHRRAAFLEQNVQETTENFARHNIAAEYRFIIAQNWNHVLFYILVGVLLFLLPAVKPVPLPTLTGYVLTIMYLMGPLAGVMSSFSVFGRASVALRRVEELGVSLDTGPREENLLSYSHARSQLEDQWNGQTKHGVSSCAPTKFQGADRFGGQAALVPASNGKISESLDPNQKPFERLELDRVVHSYHHEKEDANFVLGPVSLTLEAGELVFLVGGNGSGKSTLAKIIAGLYFPEGGEIRLNGQRIGNDNRDEYRQLFSAVFSDFFLFDTLLGLNNPNLDAQAREYLSQFHLHHKVSVRDGALSTTSVSQGQRKRLALLTVYLEDRPVFLFDEWASDQDPYFKDIFYTQLLPELKSRGKTVLVITHDDKYFHLADRVIKLDYGKLDTAPAPDAIPAFS
jgi:putative pyoverdin transport system ATP-binding/permease protein